jgi:hypothetical protein
MRRTALHDPFGTDVLTLPRKFELQRGVDPYSYTTMSASEHQTDLCMRDAVCCGVALQFLAELGIGAENPGMYNGTWGGTGALLTSVNPTTGKPIATIRQATVEEYEGCVTAMTAAQEMWQLVSVWS